MASKYSPEVVKLLTQIHEELGKNLLEHEEALAATHKAKDHAQRIYISLGKILSIEPNIKEAIEKTIEKAIETKEPERQQSSSDVENKKHDEESRKREDERRKRLEQESKADKDANEASESLKEGESDKRKEKLKESKKVEKKIKKKDEDPVEKEKEKELKKAPEKVDDINGDKEKDKDKNKDKDKVLEKDKEGEKEKARKDKSKETPAKKSSHVTMVLPPKPAADDGSKSGKSKIPSKTVDLKRTAPSDASTGSKGNDVLLGFWPPQIPAQVNASAAMLLGLRELPPSLPAYYVLPYNTKPAPQFELFDDARLRGFRQVPSFIKVISKALDVSLYDDSIPPKLKQCGQAFVRSIETLVLRGAAAPITKGEANHLLFGPLSFLLKVAADAPQVRAAVREQYDEWADVITVWNKVMDNTITAPPERKRFAFIIVSFIRLVLASRRVGKAMADTKNLSATKIETNVFKFEGAVVDARAETIASHGKEVKVSLLYDIEIRRFRHAIASFLSWRVTSSYNGLALVLDVDEPEPEKTIRLL